MHDGERNVWLTSFKKIYDKLQETTTSFQRFVIHFVRSPTKVFIGHSNARLSYILCSEKHKLLLRCSLLIQDITDNLY